MTPHKLEKLENQWLRENASLPVSDKGMVTDPQSCMAAVPFIHRLQASLDDNENEHANALMREAADFAGTPRMPDLNTIEYWLCEDRQLEEKSRPRDWRACGHQRVPRYGNNGLETDSTVQFLVVSSPKRSMPPPENSQLCQPKDTGLCSIRLP